MTRVLQRLYPDKEKRKRGRPKKKDEQEILYNSYGGFELIVALEYHLGWPQMTADAIKDAVKSLKRTKAFRSSNIYSDKKDRDKLGRFTAQYNQREDIRKSRFESITEKRRQKNWKSINVIRDGIKTIQRKSLAILSLPVVTMNGGIRTVDPNVAEIFGPKALRSLYIRLWKTGDQRSTRCRTTSPCNKDDKQTKRDSQEAIRRYKSTRRINSETYSKRTALRKQSEICQGKRELPEELMDRLNSYGKKIRGHERKIKKSEKENLDHFRLLRKHKREWLRLQGNESVFKVDVELDQIVTFHRVSLAHLYAYFIKHFLGGELISMTNLLHKIIHIHASIKETADTRKIILDYNKKDSLMMAKLASAIEKISALNGTGPQGKRMEFFLENCLS